jgi:hypothetical protein
MEAAYFTNLVRRTHGLQGLRLRFDQKTGMIGLIHLWNLCENSGTIQIDRPAVMAVLASRDWGGEHNRTVTVYGLSAADEHRISEIGRDVETMELSGHHGAQGIMVKRLKSRTEAVKKIIDDVLSDELVSEVEGWDLTIIGEFIEYHGTPAIQFMVCQADGEMLFRIILDGWTGRFGIDGNAENGPDELYVRPQQIQDFIRVSLDTYLEELTSVAA